MILEFRKAHQVLTGLFLVFIKSCLQWASQIKGGRQWRIKWYRIYRLNGIFGALGILRRWCFEDGRVRCTKSRDFGLASRKVRNVPIFTEHLSIWDLLQSSIWTQGSVCSRRVSTIEESPGAGDQSDGESIGLWSCKIGILKQAGYALLDDSASYLYDSLSGTEHGLSEVDHISWL